MPPTAEAQKFHTVGISECRISQAPQDVLATYSLGSCLGITMYDPVARVGGLIHCMLPLSSLDPARAELKPAMFVDTGVPLMMEKMIAMGAAKNRLIIKAAGAASLLDPQGAIRIGERNQVVFSKLMTKNNLRVAAEDTGGTSARSLFLQIADGLVIVRIAGRERELI